CSGPGCSAGEIETKSRLRTEDCRIPRGNPFILQSAISNLHLHKTPSQRRVSPAHLLPTDRHFKRLTATDDDDEALAASDGGVEEVPLEHHVVLRVQGNNHGRVFSAL